MAVGICREVYRGDLLALQVLDRDTVRFVEHQEPYTVLSITRWHAERRNLHADALRWFGSHPGDIVRVWLIASSVFKRQRGSFTIAGIRLRSEGAEQIVL